MSKKELIEKVEQEAKLDKKTATAAVNAVFAALASSLEQGEKVSILGFGTFETRQRPARVGRNPRTKEPTQIPASKVPAFKAGKALKDLVNK